MMIRSLLRFSRLSDTSAVRRGSAAAGLAVAVALGGAACVAASESPAGQANPVASFSVDDSSASASPADSLLTPTAASVAATSSSASPSAVPVAPVPAQTTHVAPPPQTKTTKAAPPHPSLCGAPSNPYGYNFCGVGGDVTSPASGTCSYFNCIANFSNGVGYMVECQDGTYSMSGGRRGACSDHGGVRQPVYSG